MEDFDEYEYETERIDVAKYMHSDRMLFNDKNSGDTRFLWPIKKLHPEELTEPDAQDLRKQAHGHGA